MIYFTFNSTKNVFYHVYSAELWSTDSFHFSTEYGIFLQSGPEMPGT